MTIVLITLMLVGMYACKHCLADFFWQTEYMLGKFKKPPHCLVPLAAHCAVHVAILFIMMVTLGLMSGEMKSMMSVIWVVCLYEFITHYLVDITKAQWQRVYEAKHTEPRYWYAIGLDQWAHTILGLPVIFVIAAVVTGF
ncbi:MAG: DUF3307 domain-containing protein [Aeromonas veronii]